MNICEFEDPLIGTNQKTKIPFSIYEPSFDYEDDTSSIKNSYKFETGGIEEETIPTTISLNLKPLIKFANRIEKTIRPLVDLQYSLEPVVSVVSALEPLIRVASLANHSHKIEPLIEGVNEKEVDYDYKGNDIIKELSRFSEILQDARTHEEKIDLLVKFDNFLKDNKEFIKLNCSDKLVSILRSL